MRKIGSNHASLLLAAITPHYYWQQSRLIINEVLQPFLYLPGIRVASLTKALHRKRPYLIPVCDSVLLIIFRIQVDTMDAESALSLMDNLRDVGQTNYAALKELSMTKSGHNASDPKLPKRAWNEMPMLPRAAPAHFSLTDPRAVHWP